MPFIEITGVNHKDELRQSLSARLTDGIAEAFDISREIVTVYFLTVGPRDYAHAGKLAPQAEFRTFMKVHAFRRDVAMKRRAAKAMTDAFVATTGCDPKNVVIYFFDRDPQDVAHGGAMACD